MSTAPKRYVCPLTRPLRDLINRGSFHGEDLIMAVACADNVARCEAALARAESGGLIERGNYAPSRQQRFFGIGGFSGDQLIRLQPEHRSTAAFHWITKTMKYLYDDDVYAAISGRTP